MCNEGNNNIINIMLLSSKLKLDVTNQLRLSRADILELSRSKHDIYACADATEECDFDLKMSLRKVC